MPWLSQSQERFLRAVNAVAAAHPFLPELAEAERAALGRELDARAAESAALDAWERGDSPPDPGRPTDRDLAAVGAVG